MRDHQRDNRIALRIAVGYIASVLLVLTVLSLTGVIHGAPGSPVERWQQSTGQVASPAPSCTTDEDCERVYGVTMDGQAVTFNERASVSWWEQDDAGEWDQVTGNGDDAPAGAVFSTRNA